MTQYYCPKCEKVTLESTDFYEIPNRPCLKCATPMKVSSTRPKVNYETKERIKHGGTTWEIHKNDPDPIPSKPHLHNLETGEKLNPFTGEIYNPKIKKMTGTMKEKDLDELKQKSKLLSQTSQK